MSQHYQPRLFLSAAADSFVVQSRQVNISFRAGADSIVAQRHQSAQAGAAAGAMTGAGAHLQSRCVGVHGEHSETRFPATLCAGRLHLQHRGARAECSKTSLQQPCRGPPPAAPDLVRSEGSQEALLQEPGMVKACLTLLLAHMSK